VRSAALLRDLSKLGVSNDILYKAADMTRDEVIATMGKPQIREAYGKTEFLIYRTDLPVPAGNADFTPVALMNGKVTSWGRKPYDEARRKRAEANTKKPQQ